MNAEDFLVKKLEGDAVKNNNTDSDGAELLEELDNLRQRGNKVYGVYNADISKEDIKKVAGGYAMDAIENWDEEQKQKSLDQKLDKYNKTHPDEPKTPEEFQEYLDGKRLHQIDQALSKVPIINLGYALAKGVVSLPASVKNTKKRTEQLHRYNKIAKEAIEETGALSAAGLAIDEVKNDKSLSDESIIEKVKENLSSYDERQGMYSRVQNAAESGDLNEDTGVQNIREASGKNFSEVRNETAENLTADEQIRKIFGEYAATVAGSEDAKSTREQRENMLSKIKEIKNQKSGLSTDNFGEIATQLQHDLQGSLKTELANEGTESYDIAIKAIDKYLDKYVSITSADVQAGIAAKETYASLKDKATIEHGLIIGSTVSLAGSLFGMAKSNAVNSTVGTGLAATVVKATIAGGLGAYKAHMSVKNRQGRENIKDALTGKTVENREAQNKYKVYGFNDLTDWMDENIDKETGKIIEGEDRFENAAELIAKYRTLNKLQNEKGIQLISFGPRGEMEKNKAKFFKSLNSLKQAMVDSEGIDATNAAIEGEIVDNESIKDIIGDVENTEEAQKSERRREAIKGGLIAAGVSGAISFAIHHDDIISDAKGLFIGNISASDSASEISGENLRLSNEPLVIENDPDGGVAVGFDTDHDGHIDADHYLRGKGEKAGIDLTNKDDYESLKTELDKKYNIELNRESISSAKYNEISVSEYLNNSENSVDDSGGVDWSRSETRVGFGTPVVEQSDGMDNYEVPVWGLNGQEIPNGAKLYIDLDGEGSGQALEFAIKDGKAVIPADVVDTSNVGSGGVAQFIGTVRVGEMDGNTMISHATTFGKDADLSTTISASTESSAFAFTAINETTNERISQFAVNANNETISNLSEIFNGIETSQSDRLPSVFTVNDIDDGQSDLVLANGETIHDLDVKGGYHAEFDSFENTAFKGSDTYLGTPIVWDADGDGIMSAAEKTSYVKQMLVRTGTNPYMLGQNASNYGILEPDRLSDIGISSSKLVEWGISDGVIDSEEDLNVFIEKIKLPENADYWDKVANATINEMETQLQGADFEVTTITDRLSTYANADRQFDTAGASVAKTAIYSYHEVNGEKIYDIGNDGWWCRKYGVLEGKVGDMPGCEQKCITRSSNYSGGQSNNVTPSPEPSPEPQPEPEPLTPKNPEEQIKNAGEGVTKEYVQTPASDLSNSSHEVNSNNISSHTVYTNESAARAEKAAADAKAAAAAAASQDEINKMGTEQLWDQFQKGQSQQ